MDGLATHELGLVRVLGLVCLIPVVDALSDPSPGRLTAAALGVLALAAHLFSLSGHAWTGHRIAPLGLAVVTLACGLAAHAIGGQAWALIALAAALQCAVRVDPLPAAVLAVAVCTAVAPAMGRMGDLITTVVVVAGPGVVAALRHRLLVTIAELRATRQQLADAAVRQERDRLSDDLHDLLGHSLSVIVVSAQVVQRVAAGRPDKAVEVGAEIESVGRRALDDVRAAVLGYRARSFTEESAELRRALGAAGIQAEFDAPGGTDGTGALPDEIDATLALVLRETVTNVVRHSHAGACRVAVRRERDDVTLEVADDGIGDAAAAARADAGLATVRARLARHDGRLAVEAVDPHGLRITAVVPAPRDSAPRDRDPRDRAPEDRPAS